ncbi:MAG: hypothetical protein WCW33_01920 [Candidatus Babeliales bacterium]
MLRTRSFTYGLMTLLIPAALIGAQVAPEPAITAFTPLQKLATAFVTTESIQYAFNETFIFICNLLVQQPDNRSAIKEWLRRQNFGQEINFHVDAIKKQINNIGRSMRKYTHIRSESELPLENVNSYLMRTGTALEHEHRQFHIRLIILAALLDHYADSNIFSDIKLLQKVVAEQQRPSMLECVSWLHHFGV